MERTPGKPWWRRWFGDRSERAVWKHLRSLGWRLLARNFSCKFGELDVVALDGDVIVFVEVRSTESDDASRPAASVDRKKQDRLTRLALHFLQTKKLLDRPARFDVIAVQWPAGRSTPNMDHIRNAFEATGRYQMFS
ncbi:MAG: YraN family protein [Gemmataceae bacterium]|nr:YraN family protein [Gemmataceae bacterium]